MLDGLAIAIVVMKVLAKGYVYIFELLLWPEVVSLGGGGGGGNSLPKGFQKGEKLGNMRYFYAWEVLK